jgi:hypothetical protein
MIHFVIALIWYARWVRAATKRSRHVPCTNMSADAAIFSKSEQQINF